MTNIPFSSNGGILVISFLLIILLKVVQYVKTCSQIREFLAKSRKVALLCICYHFGSLISNHSNRFPSNGFMISFSKFIKNSMLLLNRSLNRWAYPRGIFIITNYHFAGDKTRHYSDDLIDWLN